MTIQRITGKIKSNPLRASDQAAVDKKTVSSKEAKDKTVDSNLNSETTLISWSFSQIILWVFSLFLFIDGLMIGIFTFVYTLVGVFLGILLMIIAVVLPFAVHGNWFKRVV